MENLHYPTTCLRGLKTCQPLARIPSNTESFFCCGHNDGSEPPVPEDRYTLCFKGPFDDRRVFCDKRDLAHEQAVVAVALAHIAEQETNPDSDYPIKETTT